ncbi:MAG: 16S rRNA (uracil(1498)-N(3))-methyltransferase [Gemmatimonadota bacterium]|nr:16S rRNA (uracil(1498)-N(3))-methyltransferase [Gemmatimonadota bacterium]
MHKVAENLPTFITNEHFVAGTVCALGDDAVRHLKVLRLAVGAKVGLRDGAGLVGHAKIVKVAKGHAQVEVLSAAVSDPLPDVHLLVPVADRERLLWLAEKASELGATSWRPVLWRRSRSVAPRGEGPAFQAKLRARMLSALAQSQGAWIPQIFPEANLERALLAAPPGDRIVLDVQGEPMVGPGAPPLVAPVVIALGPEGGLEDDELGALKDAGFRSAGLGGSILRFETAGIAALAIARTALGIPPLKRS